MSNPVQAVLSLAGAAIGWALTFGSPGGAALGYAIGSALGSAISPTDLGTREGPRLTDARMQSATIGLPIPIVYGVYALAGNVIWQSQIIETMKKKKQGGKGAPTQKVKTYSYRVNIAIGICEGPIGKVFRIWANARTIYDNRPQGATETASEYSARLAANAKLEVDMTIYSGGEAQSPDPTIESFEGAGNVSAFRGLAYVVFNDFQLAEYGNAIPSFRFEVCSPWDGTEGTCQDVTVGDIIADVCERSGIDLAYVDVDDLIDPVIHKVDGYMVARAATGRAMISPLTGHTLFDCVESGGILKWTARGKAAVAQLAPEDLAAFASGGARPESTEVRRTQEVELPRRLRLHYAQVSQDYEFGEQSAARIAENSTTRVTMYSELEWDVELPIAMSEQKAAQCAEILLYEAWYARTAYQIRVSTQWMFLEPGDAITAPVDGRQERMRIVAKDHSLPGLLTFNCVADDDGVYQSYAVGAETPYVGADPQGLDTAGTEKFVALDIPVIRASGVDFTDAGYFVAACAEDATYFAGAVLYRADDLVTFEEVASTDLPATMGTLDADLPAGPTTIFDEGNELVVTLDSGDLESFPESSVLLGYNTAAIGADGRWEIIQFRDAELVVSSPQTNTWRLTGLLRGRRGTEWAVGTAMAGDWFVLLDEALMRAPLQIARIDGEVAHKVVLVGNAIGDSTAENFTPRGVGLEPFSPIDLVVTPSGGDLVLTWVRRSRAGTELPGNVDIPLLEVDERYEVDVFDAAASPLEPAVRTLAATAPTATYTASDQTADWGGSPPPLIFRVYQMSAVAGRGYALEGTYG